MVDYEVLNRDGDLACLMLRGELEGDVPSEVLKRELERHYVDDGVRTICVKLNELDLITTAGVGILLELWIESRNRGKRFVVQDPQGQVLRKLHLTGLLGTFSEP